MLSLVFAMVLASQASETEQLTAEASAAQLLQASSERMRKLGTYRMRFTKEERLDDGWLSPQVMDLVIRERPYAVRAEVVAGPNQGRRFLYDETQNQRELRVRERGLLGLVPVWIDIDSPLTRDDTRHPVTELGYGFILKMIERDARLGTAGLTHVDEGVDNSGARCLMITAPKDVPGLYASRTRLCLSPATLTITKVEVWDGKGARERFALQLIEEDVKDRGAFSLAANQLE